MTTLLAPLPLSLSLSLSSSGLVDQSRRRRRRQICSVSATRRSDERETKRRSTRQQQQQQQQQRRAIFWIRATVSSAGDDYVDGSKDTDDAAADLLQRLDEPITLDARVIQRSASTCYSKGAPII